MRLLRMPDTKENYRILDQLINQCADNHNECINCPIEDECVDLYERLNNALFKRTITKRAIPQDIFDKYWSRFFTFIEIREAFDKPDFVMPGSILDKLQSVNRDIVSQPILP